MHTLSQRLLAWYDRHGRHNLPWQQTPRTLYHIWVAEVMLQQTTVKAVIPYYERFIDRFPDVASLAHAPNDHVMALWSGLGYYARARNLLAAARHIESEHGGRFPTLFEEVNALPGIGPSTAGAILSQGLGQRHTILDGNVKRVLTRVHAVRGWPGQATVVRKLWTLADQLTPHERNADYTQAIMDLGAICCTRRTPACSECPWKDDCCALRSDLVSCLPEARPVSGRCRRKTQVSLFLISDGHGHILLEQRPVAGVWGGLWSLPEEPFTSPLEPGQTHRPTSLDMDITIIGARPAFTHVLSHFDLIITPVLARMESHTPGCMDGGGRIWYKAGSERHFGLPAPVSDLLDQLGEALETEQEEATWRKWCSA